MTNDSASKSPGLATLCIHGGARPGPAHPEVVPPIVRSTTFVQGEARGQSRERPLQEPLIYSRYANPTVRFVERRLALLESAPYALLFSSGMAAMHAGVLALAPRGSTILASDRLYGGTQDLLAQGRVL